MNLKEIIFIIVIILIGGTATFLGGVPDPPAETSHYMEVEEEKRQYKAQDAAQDADIMHQVEPISTEIEQAEEKPTEEQKDLTGQNMSPYDISLLERVVMSEASIESYETKVAVCETILNRANLYGISIEEVVTAPYQYSMAYNGDPTEEVKSAVKQALEYRTYDTRMIYFREDYYHDFGVPYMNIGPMYFSLRGE